MGQMGGSCLYSLATDGTGGSVGWSECSDTAYACLFTIRSVIQVSPWKMDIVTLDYQIYIYYEREPFNLLKYSNCSSTVPTKSSSVGSKISTSPAPDPLFPPES